MILLIAEPAPDESPSLKGVQQAQDRRFGQVKDRMQVVERCPPHLLQAPKDRQTAIQRSDGFYPSGGSGSAGHEFHPVESEAVVLVAPVSLVQYGQKTRVGA